MVDPDSECAQLKPVNDLTRRIPEPELMDEQDQVQAYAEADFTDSIALFLAQLNKVSVNSAGRILDLGCGPGEISQQIQVRFPGAHVVAVDGAPKMIEWAERNYPGPDYVLSSLNGFDQTQFDLIVSNSLLHHLHQPSDMWQTIKRCANPSASVVVMDLFRPESCQDAQRIVDENSDGEAEVLKRDFYHSLCAAFRIEEVKEQLRQAGLDSLKVTEVSERHLLVYGQL